MGNYPAVTIQDFALAKELFNRLYEWSLIKHGHLLIWKNTRMLGTRMLFMENDNHRVFREEWCGRGKTIISRYLRSDSGKNKVSEQSTQIDKKCKDFI